MKTIIELHELRVFMAHLRNIKKPYQYIKSGNSITLIVKGTKYYCNSLHTSQAPIPANQCYFINKVKKHIIGNNLTSIPANYKNTESIKYFDYCKTIKAGTEIRDCYLVDIKSAYWQSAYKNGFLDDSIYTEGQAIDKRVRLASLGSFAKVTAEYYFDGATEHFVKETIPEYPHVFFNQANDIYKVMRNCQKAIKGAHILTWTDGIKVCTQSAAAICADIIQQSGFISKPIEPIGSIFRTHNSFLVNNKPFFIPIC